MMFIVIPSGRKLVYVKPRMGVNRFGNANHTGICPKCGERYTGHPALSRLDGETAICPDCGTREALDTLGISHEEQEQIIDAIHRSLAI